MGAKQLLKDARNIKAKMNVSQGDTYYELENQIRAKLNDVLDADLNELSKAQLFELISYCSSHRPKAVHVILMDMAAFHSKGGL